MTELDVPPVDVVEKYLETHTDGVFSLAGDGNAQLVVSGKRDCLAYRRLSDGTMPKVQSYSNIHVSEVVLSDKIWTEVTFDIEANLVEVYAVVSRIASRVQEGGETFESAVAQSLEALAEILDRRAGLSTEQRVGLFGELLVLLSILVDGQPGLEGPQGWQGADNEEHDFRLTNFDLEVKTTTNESREHWISSPTQLVPTAARSLYLMSIQITGAGAGSGWTLPELVSLVRSKAGAAAPAIDASLAKIGYRDSDAPLYPKRWALRTEPAAYAVDSKFPAITSASLDRLGKSVATHISDFRYRINLSGMDPVSLPISFERLPGGLDIHGH
jgi:hypothetical protein